MNEKLYVKNPEDSDLGRNIVLNSIRLIYDLGFEKFNFKKLALEIGTTEAGVYRYFGNKHKLLVYLTNWYWSWLEYQIISSVKNELTSLGKIQTLIYRVCSTDEGQLSCSHVDEAKLHKIIIREGTKAYLTQDVSQDNQDKLFKPYKELCATIGDIIKDCDPAYKYPRSLASAVIEIAHFQTFFKNNLPALTDFDQSEESNSDVILFIESLVLGKLNLKD
jgi:AcrR family transcriptional regulator